MFCMTCGKELPNEARFCLHCGATQPQAANTLPAAIDIPLPASLGSTPAQPPKTSPATPPRPAKPMLRDYYLLDWKGECPACNLVQGNETSLCVNDNSKVAVAFKDIKRPRVSRLPLYAADLRCLNDCGVKVQAFPCPRCGAAIKGRYLRFRFPAGVRNLHRLYHYSFRLIWFGLLGVTLACGYSLFKDFQEWQDFNRVALKFGLPTASTPPERLYPYVNFRTSVLIFSFFFVGLTRNRLWWYKGKEWFDFTDVAKDAERHAKAKRIREAVETAKATQAATQPFKFGS